MINNINETFDASKYIDEYQGINVLNLKSNGIDRPSKEAYILNDEYLKLDVNNFLLELPNIQTNQYYTQEYLNSSSDFTEIFLAGKNSKPYYIHVDIFKILQLEQIDEHRKKIIKISQFIRQYFNSSHPLLQGIFIFDKWAKDRENDFEDYVRADLINPGLQKSSNGLYTLRFQGSRTGGVAYSKRCEKQNRENKEKYLRFAQHGNNTKELVCCKTGKRAERIPEKCPLTGDQTLPTGYDLHHPKFSIGGSENKNGKEPSGILTKASWSTKEKIEMLGCLVLRCGVHNQHHRRYTGSQDLTWWEKHWETGNGYKPFILRSEENYNKVLDYFEILYENDVPSYNEFLKTLYF